MATQKLKNERQIKVIPHPFPEFQGKYTVKDKDGIFCGAYRYHVPFGLLRSFSCPSVFHSKERAAQFAKDELLRDIEVQSNIEALLD